MVLRSDYLGTQVLLLLCALGYPVVTLGPWLLAWAGGRPLAVRGLAPGGAGPVVGDPSGAVVDRCTHAVVRTIAHPSVDQWLVALLPAVLTSVLLVAGVVVVRRLVLTTQHGEPFDRRAVRWLRVLGLLVLGFALVSAFGDAVTMLAVLGAADPPSIAFEVDTAALLPFLVGLLVLVLAEGFRVGLALRDDVEGLV